MKRYFAKYLPVEGEIKMGDKIIHGNVQLKEGWNWGYHDINNEEDVAHFTKIKELMENSKHPFPKQVMTKIVKLFLCSRDIQVGDVVHYPGFDLPFKVCNKESDEDIQWGFLKDVKEKHFKIIGEISPEAIWVKEGDEFDEDDFSIEFLRFECYNYNGEHIGKDCSCKGGDMREVNRIKIKCPTCH